MTLLKQAEKRGGKFLNPVPTEMAGLATVMTLLPQYFNNPAETEPKQPLGPFPTDVRAYGSAPASGLRVTWFGHSASLVEIDGMRVLIDPVWDKRASPSRFFGPKRFFPPTIGLESLPKIDVVLISHDHYDHLGAETVRQLSKLAPTAWAKWVTSLGVGKRLRGFGVATAQIMELDWTESVQVGELTVTAWPARHFSGRGVLDRFKTLWSSFVIEGPEHRVLYGADSGWWEGFGEIAAQYEDGFDLTMLEIGAFHPLWANIHLGPENASRAIEAMGGKAGLFMPIHWGLFNLALHGWREPVEEIVGIASGKQIPLWLPRPGAPTEVVAGERVNTGWWK